ncbi:MAG TPA: anion permease [Clostridia bacterium]|nr:anion permease [Clostridia bacterium]
MNFIAQKTGETSVSRGFNKKKALGLALSPLLPLGVFLLRPFGMDMQQSAVIAILLLVIIWWCTGLVNKILSSAVLLTSFIFLTPASLTTIFSFPLSDNFLLIALTYLFSRGIANSKVTERFLEPLLVKYASTPLRAMLTVTAMFALTMYIIPQPLARLIIMADIFSSYLSKTGAEERTKKTLMFSVFVIYVFINMCTLKADIIINTLAVNVAELNFADWDWIRYMAVPSLAYLVLVIGLMLFLFRKDLKARFTISKSAKEGAGSKLTKRDIGMLALLGVTMAMWATESIHGVPAWLVTLASIVAMAVLGVFKLRDIKSLDVTMLVFLTAAMSIGGVMRANGTAELIFSFLGQHIPNGSPTLLITVLMFIAISMHMILGSNSTTISVVIPGLIVMCGDMLSPAIVMCVVYVTLATQWLFPFHSVGMMMGISQGSFPSSHMLKMGLPMTLLVFAAIFGLYIPWWRMLGLL